MAEKWYPVIDYALCIDCGTCVEKCPHGVYDVSKAPSPVVVNPVSCIDHCHGCGNRCPVGAITYVGDDTGWIPQTGTQAEDKGACGCGSTENESSGCCGSPAKTEVSICCGPSKTGVSICCAEPKAEEKVVSVEYLYLDLQTCDRCIGTDSVLEEVMADLTPALELAGYRVEYSKIEMKTEELARKYQFLSSPTIRVNGRDICASVKENSCGCCGEISGTNVDCRVFEYGGEAYEIPPKEMLAEGILQAVFGPEENTSSGVDYHLPDNLKSFFEGKRSKSSCCGGEAGESSCSCGGSCG